MMVLSFGRLIAFLVIGSSPRIMSRLDHDMMPMDHIMRMQR